METAHESAQFLMTKFEKSAQSFVKKPKKILLLEELRGEPEFTPEYEMLWGSTEYFWTSECPFIRADESRGWVAVGGRTNDTAKQHPLISLPDGPQRKTIYELKDEKSSLLVWDDSGPVVETVSHKGKYFVVALLKLTRGLRVVWPYHLKAKKGDRNDDPGKEIVWAY